MNLHRGQRHGPERVGDRQRSVGIGARVDDDRARARAHLLDARDDLALDVRLEALDGEAALLCALRQGPIDLVEGRGAVDLGLTGAEEVQVRPVDDGNVLFQLDSSVDSLGDTIRKR